MTPTITPSLIAEQGNHIEIYTDGACSGNPGPGGWACILICGNKQFEFSGYEASTTNNRMELQAAISALDRISAPNCKIDVYTDSAYLCNAFNQHWVTNWQRNGWQTAYYTHVINADLWEQLILLDNTFDITWHKVKGHSGNIFNDRCDELARNEITKNRG